MTLLAFFQGSGGATGQFLYNLLPIAAIGLVFYFVVIAPANKQRRQTQEMLSSLKKNDKVLTTGGIYGTVQSVEGEVVYLKIAENVKIKVARSAISGIEAGTSAE